MNKIEQLYNAVQLCINDTEIRNFLQKNDPKALEQLITAAKEFKGSPERKLNCSESYDFLEVVLSYAESNWEDINEALAADHKPECLFCQCRYVPCLNDKIVENLLECVKSANE